MALHAATHGGKETTSGGFRHPGSAAPPCSRARIPGIEVLHNLSRFDSDGRLCPPFDRLQRSFPQRNLRLSEARTWNFCFLRFPGPAIAREAESDGQRLELERPRSTAADHEESRT